MVGREVLPVPAVAQQVLFLREDVERNRSRVAVLAVRHHVLRLGFRLHPVEDLLDRHARPSIVEAAPRSDAVDVRGDRFRGQRAELAVVEPQLVLDGAEYLEVPPRDVGLRHGAEVQQRPPVRGREGLPGRDARRVHALGKPLAFEEECHRREYRNRPYGVGCSLGVTGPGLYWRFRLPRAKWARSSAGRARESHSRGQGFESPRVHQTPKLKPPSAFACYADGTHRMACDCDPTAAAPAMTPRLLTQYALLE